KEQARSLAATERRNERAIDRAGRLTNAQAAKLAQFNEDARRKVAESAVKDRLADTEAAEDKKLEEALVKFAAGEELSKGEMNTIAKSEGGIGMATQIGNAVAKAMETEVSSELTWDWETKRQTTNKNAAAEVDGKEENVQGIRYEGGDLQIKTDSGWHAAAEVALPEEVQELVDALAPYRQSAGVMYRMYQNGQDINKFVEAWRTAENTYGANSNASLEQARKAFNPADLSDAQLEMAFSMGRERKAEREKAEAKKPKQDKYTERKAGNVSYDGAEIEGVKYKAVDRSKLDRSQRRQIKVIEKLAEMFKIDFVLFESEADEKGKFKGAQGAFRANTIYLDVNAGKTTALGTAAIVRTAAHELTHYLQANNREGYNTLKDFMLRTLSEQKGISINRLIAQKQARSTGRISEDEAIDEIVADGCEMMLRDTRIMEALAEEEPGLFNDIKKWLANWVREVKNAFRGLTAVHEEAKAMTDHMEQLQRLWDEAMLKAIRGEGTAPKPAQAAETRQEAETEAQPVTVEAKAEAQQQSEEIEEELDTTLEALSSVEYSPYEAPKAAEAAPVKAEAPKAAAKTETKAEAPQTAAPAISEEQEFVEDAVRIFRDVYGTDIVIGMADMREIAEEAYRNDDTLAAAARAIAKYNQSVIEEQLSAKYEAERAKAEAARAEASKTEAPAAEGYEDSWGMFDEEETSRGSADTKQPAAESRKKTDTSRIEYSAEDARSAVADILSSGNITAEEISHIIDNSYLRNAYAEETGETLPWDRSKAAKEILTASNTPDSKFAEITAEGFVRKDALASKDTKDGDLVPAMFANAAGLLLYENGINLDGRKVPGFIENRGLMLANGQNERLINKKERELRAHPQQMQVLALAPRILDGNGRAAMSYDEWAEAVAKGNEGQYSAEVDGLVRDFAEALRALQISRAGNGSLQSLEGKIPQRILELAKNLEERGMYSKVERDGKSWSKENDSDRRGESLDVIERSESGKAETDVGVGIDTKTESVYPAVQYSERTWSESEYVQHRNKAAQQIANATGVSVKKAKAYIDDINSIAKMIADDRARLDYEASPGRTSFVGNVEYGGSFDFSTICKKRRLLTGTFTAIQKALPNTALTANEILEIRRRMQEAGLEVSCGLCYVEGSRANMGVFAKEFLRLYQKYYPNAWQPNMADVNTPEGIEWVRINHPECYEQYEYFWNHYGTLRPGDKNLFASQQKPKLYQLHTEYKGEILQKFTDEGDIEEKNKNGGIRLQSFSDFEIVHLIDTMQIIMDMSRVGLAGQAYTKVPDFAWALGDTGIKINLSLIAKGVDADGRLIFDDIEGMPIADAMALRDRYSKNVGTILVAFNDEQLYAAMADDRVDFIIPFHRSQWKKSQYEAMGLPARTKDYTYMQNEKYIKPQYHEYRGRMVRDKASNYMPNEYWDFSKSGRENAEAYLQMCAENNKRPKFYKLLQNNGDGSYSLKADGSTDGYWKLLIDFKMYDNDGVGSPQTPVKPEFNMEQAQRMLNEYRGGHSTFPAAQGIVDRFVSEYKEKHGEAIKFSERDSTPTFYSLMARVVNGVKQEKLGAASVVSMLKGKGVKNEEIKWSGIEAWLEGKKSVTKAELQEFIQGSMLQIEEKVQAGGSKITLEPSSYSIYGESNDLNVMRGGEVFDTLTWDDYNERYESDSLGYSFKDADEIIDFFSREYGSGDTRWEQYKLDGGENYREILFKMPGSSYSNRAMKAHWGDEAKGILAHARIQDFETAEGKMLFVEEIQSDWHNEGHKRGYEETAPVYEVKREEHFWNKEPVVYLYKNGERTHHFYYDTEEVFDEEIDDWRPATDSEYLEMLTKDVASNSETVPDAPFRDTYHEYVLKRLIREAAEKGYDSIGWTTAAIQSDRWSDEYAEGYRIEYDQDIPKFLNKYGKKWGAKVEKTILENGETVWSMKLTDSMKKSVLAEGQPLYSERDIMPDERELLLSAAARSGAPKELRSYRNKVREVERLTAKLNELEDKAEAGEDVQSEIEKTEAALDKAEQKLRQLETTSVIRGAADRALAEWRGMNNTEAAKLIRRLNEEVEAQAARIKYLLEELQLSGEGNRRADASDIRKMAAELKEEFGSRISSRELSEQLQELADYVIGGSAENLDSRVIQRKARAIAEMIVDNAYYTEDSSADIYDDLRNYLKATTLKISDELRGEATEGIKALRNMYFGRINLGNEGRAIDSAYRELNELFGEHFFPGDVTAHIDQLEQIAAALDAMRPKEINLFDRPQRAEISILLTERIASTILSGDIKQRETLADKKIGRLMKELEQMKAEIKAETKAERTARNALEEERALRRQLVQKKVRELREDSQKRAKATKARNRIRKKVQRLYKTLMDNTGKNHVPDDMKGAFAAYLRGIDTLSTRASAEGRKQYADMVRNLERVMAEYLVKKDGDVVEADLATILLQLLGNHKASFLEAINAENSGDISLWKMTAEQLKEVEDILKIMNTALEEDKDLRLGTEKGRISEVALKVKDYLQPLAQETKRNPIKKFLNWDNLNPAFFAERFGEGGEEIFKGLQAGWARFAFRIREVINFTEEAYTTKYADQLSKEIVTVSLYRRLSDTVEEEEARENGENVKVKSSAEKEKVRMTKAQIMSLYGLSLRPAARDHIYASGIKVAPFKEKGNEVAQAARYLITPQELANIVTTHLSEEDRLLVERLMDYMSTTGSQWGNEVTEKRWGIKFFQEEKYFPMKTDENSRDVRAPEAQRANLFLLSNQGFTKKLVPNAKNALVISNVFDVFANHMADMAKYSTLSLPAIDMMRLWNYRGPIAENEEGQRTNLELRELIKEVYGNDAENYFTTLMADLNGNMEGGRGEDFMSKLTSRYKIAAVGANLRVALLQPTSIVRAAAVLDSKYIAQVSTLSGDRLRQAKAEMLKYSGEAVWKQMGFRDVNLNANVRELIKHLPSKTERLQEWSMFLAEKADEITWARLWEACKREVQNSTNLQGEELMKAVADKFQEVVYKTQVWDSTLTKSQLMRGKNQFTAMITSFMSEPVLTYNLLLRTFNEIELESRRTGWAAAWQSKKGIVYKCLAIYVAQAAAAGFMGALANALRDDDKYESFVEKWLSAFGENFLGELNPLDKIPLVKDVISIFSGEEVDRTDMTVFQQVFRSYQI
ncbi:MAG: hypothetical protein II206_04510, partial [Bacteroidaceae bacterium]|nr:hypothetical protein [Bacteroidaceae bacterium]